MNGLSRVCTPPSQKETTRMMSPAAATPRTKSIAGFLSPNLEAKKTDGAVANEYRGRVISGGLTGKSLD